MTSLLLLRLVIERFNSRRLLVPGLFAIAVSIGSSSAAAQSTSFGPQEVITTSADFAEAVYATFWAEAALLMAIAVREDAGRALAAAGTLATAPVG